MQFPPVRGDEMGSGLRKNLTYLIYGSWCDSVHWFQALNSSYLLLCEEMLGGSTPESRLASPLETLEVPLCLEISWYKAKKTNKQTKKHIRTPCQLFSSKFQEKSYLKMKFGVFTLLSSSAFSWVTLKWNLNVVASGSNLWKTAPWVALCLCFYLLPSLQFVRKI